MMEFVERIVTSNLLLTCLTFLLGVSCSLLIRHDYFLKLAKVVSVFIAFFLGFSFLFNIGEVYQFSDYYKRSFFRFGDGVGGGLLFLIFVAVFYNKSTYFYILVAALSLTVSKVSFVLFIIGMFLLYFYSIEYRKRVLLRSVLSIPFAFICYFCLAYLSNLSSVQAYSNEIQKTAQLSIKNVESFPVINNSYKKQNYKFCEKKYECLKKQSMSSLSDRYFSSIGGLWMTIDGSFMGRDVYPNSADKFAKLMMSSNPYNINEEYNLDYSDWFRMGQPQNPYISFSSGYGIGGLLSIFILVCSTFIVAVYILPMLKNTSLAAYPVFFITYAVFNQTQLYINPFDGNLFLLGYAAGWVYILGYYFVKYKFAENNEFLELNPFSKTALSILNKANNI